MAFDVHHTVGPACWLPVQSAAWILGKIPGSGSRLLEFPSWLGPIQKPCDLSWITHNFRTSVPSSLKWDHHIPDFTGLLQGAAWANRCESLRRRGATDEFDSTLVNVTLPPPCGISSCTPLLRNLSSHFTCFFSSNSVLPISSFCLR